MDFTLNINLNPVAFMLLCTYCGTNITAGLDVLQSTKQFGTYHHAALQSAPTACTCGS